MRLRTGHSRNALVLRAAGSRLGLRRRLFSLLTVVSCITSPRIGRIAASTKVCETYDGGSMSISKEDN